MPNPQAPAVELDLQQINAELRHASAREVVQWAMSLGKKTIATTSFGRNAAVMLHLVSEVDKSVPTIWVDTGYNLRDTYVVAERLIKDLQLNMHVYSPQMTSERRNAIMGGIPTIDDEERHTEFTRQVKLEPFSQAIEEFQPEVWLTGIRREETDHRKSLDIVSLDKRGIIKVAPIFYWSEEQTDEYMEQHQLSSCRHYFDPTKVQDGRECGLHTAA
ncbi:MAG: phosphoadenosine phosphosulfate reductase family protein [Proteobacteria bacterium]|nr:phosphoadenosine phosphosulfate reductase family protein [Pseudomonadota bacterium]